MNQLKLTIKKINYTCDFQLSWSNNRILVAQLEYPKFLIDIYEEWRTAYLKYYENLRIKIKGVILDFPNPDDDWHKILRDRECKFKADFNRWLGSYELEKIRKQILNLINNDSDKNTQILIACSSRELIRLPWETWNIGSELGATNNINIARTTINNSLGNKSISKFRKPRILAIIGNDPNLDFSQDKAIIQSLSKLAHVHFLEDSEAKDNLDFTEKIFDAINNQEGWDILFFIGHSNEANHGGEFYLTTNTSLKTKYLKSSLSQAAKNGLQLAFFNSCSGIDIAEYLIELGLNQVIVMREPVNNKVAYKYLENFVENLSKYKNVQTSFTDSSDFFQRENIQHQYPSAYLIPSLYRHADARFFKFTNWKRESKTWFPNKHQTKCLLLLLFLSLIPAIQDLFLETRVFTQSLYRQATKQTYPIKTPPTLLVQIDEQSLTKANLPWRSRQEIDRRYLAQLINNLSEKTTSPKVIGIDYKLWEPKPPEDNLLKQAIETGIKNHNQFVFAASKHEQKTVIPQIANPQTTLQGDINLYLGYLELLPKNDDCQNSCPFAYLLALTNALPFNPVTPEKITKYITQPHTQNPNKTFLQQIRLPSITVFSHNFSQMWFHPILDFSISPEQIYTAIPAWCFLTTETNSTCKPLDTIQEPIIIIAPGGYEEADDNFSPPLSLQLSKKTPNSYLTGGEIHAYMVHHFLNRQIITPIPDFLIILLSAILAQGIILNLHPSHRKKWLLILAVGNVIYILVCLQMYILLKILIPCLLPSVLLWSYIRLSIDQT